jgi:flavin-dependent dehydrogenase
MAAEGASLIGDAALTTAALTVRGMATAVYEHIMADSGGALDS